MGLAVDQMGHGASGAGDGAERKCGIFQDLIEENEKVSGSIGQWEKV